MCILNYTKLIFNLNIYLLYLYVLKKYQSFGKILDFESIILNWFNINYLC